MDVLLDTHTILWFSENNTKLSKSAKTLIEDTNNRCYVSIASIWEIAIKVSLNKLQMKITLENLAKEIQSHGFDFLQITHEHATRVSDLEFIHRDPFDRLLVSQSKIENVSIVSKDEIFDKYNIQRIW